MFVKTLITLVCSIAGFILYRMGGAAGYNTKFRDLGIPTVAIGLLWYLTGQFTFWYILCFGLLFGAHTTYWKKKGADALWYNWILTGLGYSLAFLPYSLYARHFVGFCLRTIIVTIGVMVWSIKVDNAVYEEGGRGVIEIITIPLLLI